MDITPRILAHRLAYLAPDATLRSANNVPLRGVRLVRDAPRAAFDPQRVYVGRAADFGRGQPAHALVVAEAADFAVALNATLAVFEEYAVWDARLTEVLTGGGGLQDLIDASFDVFGANPIYIVDTSFTTRAWSRQIPADALDEGWANIAGKGHADPREIRLLRNTGTLTAIHEFPAASFFNYPAFHYPAIIAHIRLAGERVASLVALEFASALTPAHLDLADHFTRVAGQLLSRAARPGQPPRATQAAFLLDHLLGNSYRADVRDFHLSLLGWRRIDRYRIARIRPRQPKGSDDTIARGLDANLLQSLLPESQSCMVEDSVVVVARAGRPGSEFEPRLAAFLEQGDQLAGLSCVFDDFAALPHYFRQATAALELGPAEAPGARLHPYETVAARHLIQAATETVGWRALCHPAILRLAAQDAARHTEHVTTLQTYLTLDRSLVQSSHALNIHRNTLIYRLDRITDLLGVDLEDAAVRLHLLLSCQMVRAAPQTGEPDSRPGEETVISRAGVL